MSILNWWQNLPLGFDGSLLSIAGFELQYYSLAYMVAFAVCYWLLAARNREKKVMNKKELEDLFFWMLLGVILGGRLGYVVFYNLEYYVLHPLEIIWPFKSGEFVGISGMSFHGGLLACLVTGVVFVKKEKLNLSKVSDLIMSVAPFGYFIGRVGNFLNNELYGRITSSNIGMHFQDWPDVLRHPSQLYQGFLEGLALFLVLSFLYKKNWMEGKLLGVGLIWFGLMRFVVEFFREPDSHLGLMVGLSRGQYLSSLLVLLGIGFIIWKSKESSLDK